jgi:hypothetical protein
MILEYAQLLCTAHRVLDGDQWTDRTANGSRIKRWSHPKLDDVLYKATHVNHPSAVWVRQSRQNYLWLYKLFNSLCYEYSYRYGKRHLCDTKLSLTLSQSPDNIPDVDFTEPTPAMPDKYKKLSSIASYRLYYIKDKMHLASWTKRDVPHWFGEVA